MIDGSKLHHHHRAAEVLPCIPASLLLMNKSISRRVIVNHQAHILFDPMTHSCVEAVCVYVGAGIRHYGSALTDERKNLASKRLVFPRYQILK